MRWSRCWAYVAGKHGEFELGKPYKYLRKHQVIGYQLSPIFVESVNIVHLDSFCVFLDIGLGGVKKFLQYSFCMNKNIIIYKSDMFRLLFNMSVTFNGNLMHGSRPVATSLYLSPACCVNEILSLINFNVI